MYENSIFVYKCIPVYVPCMKPSSNAHTHALV